MSRRLGWLASSASSWIARGCRLSSWHNFQEKEGHSSQCCEPISIPAWSRSARSGNLSRGRADRQGKVIREVALARFGLPLPEHQGQELEVRVALIRDWRRLVPKAPSSEEEDRPLRWDERPDGTHEYWLDENWQATPLPAQPMEPKLIPIVTTATEADAVELVHTYTRRWPAQENAIPTRRSCRATPPPMKKRRIESRCSDTRDRAHIVSRNQTTRLIWVGAGTTPCRAGERLFASSTRDVNLRFCPSKPEHPLLNRKKSTGALAWKFSTPTAQGWMCRRRR
jgi:hypothetical protein